MKISESLKPFSIWLVVLGFVILVAFEASGQQPVGLTPQESTYVSIFAVGALLLPSILTMPPTATVGDVFILRGYVPLKDWIDFGVPEGFVMLSKKNNLLSKKWIIGSPSERGFYTYVRWFGDFPTFNKISILSKKEYLAGVVNPTKKDFDRNPIIGGLLQSVWFIGGFGYIYADEISTETGWQGIKSILLTMLASAFYSFGESRGLQYNENPGFYIGLGIISLTAYDVVKIINAKNEYAKELRGELRGVYK